MTRRWWLSMAVAAVAAAYGQAEEKSFGILLLAHGGAPQWNEEVTRLAGVVGRTVPTEVAFGMASKASMEGAITRLRQRKVSRIVAVPLFVSSHSSVITATQYLLGLRAEAPAELAAFARMSHHYGGHGPVDAGASPSDPAAPIATPLPVQMTPALDADPVVAEILLSRAKAISKVPARETVVLVAHGPVSDEDNHAWLRDMGALAVMMRERGEFRRIDHLTVRDDAPEPVRSRAAEELRGVVERASHRGERVLIVPLLISYGGIEKGIRKRLEGLQYTMSPQGLLPDERLAQWILQSAQKQN
jgi:sirohydrochlorin ferrochelatase